MNGEQDVQVIVSSTYIWLNRTGTGEPEMIREKCSRRSTFFKVNVAVPKYYKFSIHVIPCLVIAMLRVLDRSGCYFPNARFANLFLNQHFKWKEWNCLGFSTSFGFWYSSFVFLVNIPNFLIKYNFVFYFIFWIGRGEYLRVASHWSRFGV